MSQHGDGVQGLTLLNTYRRYGCPDHGVHQPGGDPVAVGDRRAVALAGGSPRPGCELRRCRDRIAWGRACRTLVSVSRTLRARAVRAVVRDYGLLCLP